MGLKSHQSTFEERLGAIAGLVLGLSLIAGGFWLRHIDAQERATLNDIQGKVVDSVSRRERDTANHQDKVTYAPVIEFLADGKPIRFTGRYESYRSSNGNLVVVRYATQNPSTTARVVDPLEGLTPWGMFGIGGFAVVVSVAGLLPIGFSNGRSDGRS